MSSDLSDALVGWIAQSRAYGFLGPGPVAPQIEHAAAFWEAVRAADESADASRSPDTFRCVDLGAGGGLPGLVLACQHPSTHWLFLDGNQRRTSFLLDAVHDLGLQDRVVVRCERAELTGRSDLRGRFDLVVARGFAAPSATAECAAPLLSVGGLLVVSEPPDAPARWSEEELSTLGFDEMRLHSVPFRFFSARLRRECPSAFPRRVGVPVKRPLF